MSQALELINHGVAQGKTTTNQIKLMIGESNINHNIFYKNFQSEKMDKSRLKYVFQQYYYYIRTFPKILSGLSVRVDNEIIRMKLARTVVSELGDNGEGKPHYEMFEDVLSGLNVKLDDWQSFDYEPEALALVEGIKDIFLTQHTDCAIGAHYVIEEFGFPMIVALYEGFRNYDGWTHEDYSYFFLHILIEANHVDWIGDAVAELEGDPEARKRMINGADQILSLLSDFWIGLNRIAYSKH